MNNPIGKFSLHFALLAIFTLLNTQIEAQTKTANISGIICDYTSKAPVQFVTLALLNQQDSSFLQTYLTDTTGRFSFSVKPDKFFLQANRIGYDEIKYRIVDFSKVIQNYLLDTIFLSPQSINLNEVVITSTRPMILATAKGYQVEVEFNPIINKNISVFDALRSIPGIMISGDQVSMIGRSEVVFQIDGIDKKIPAESLIIMLKSMQTDKLSKIEVIRNPGAASDASTTAIINLILKKKLNSGLYGSVDANIATYQKYGIGSDISLITPKLIYTLGVNCRTNSTFSQSNSSIHYIVNKELSDEFVENTETRPIKNDILSVFQDLSYKINSKFTIGGSLNYWGYKTKIETISSLKDPSSDSTGKDSRNISISDNSSFSSFTFDAYAKYDITPNKNLILQGNYYTYNSPGNRLIYTSFRNPVSYDNYQNARNSNPTSITGKIIYSSKINEKLNLDCGFEYVNIIYNDGKVETTLQNSTIFHDLDQSYKSNENDVSTFIDFGYQNKKWSMQVGIRGEYDKRNFTVIQSTKPDFSFKSSDKGIYPTFSTNYNFTDNQSLNLSLKRSITRPYYASYVPFESLISSSLSYKGNPEINPYFKNTIELSYHIQPNQKIFVMANCGINSSKGIIMPGIIYNEESKMLNATQLNLADLLEIYSSLSMQNSFFSWLTCQTSLSLSKLKYSNYISNEYIGENNNNVNFTLNENVSLQLPYKTTINLYYTFVSSSTTAQGSQKAFNSIFAMASRNFVKDKLNIAFSIRNPFISGKTTIEYHTATFLSSQTNINESAVSKISVKYKFGKTKRNDISIPDKIQNTRL